MMNKRMLAVAVLMAGVLTFAGCGNSGNNTAETDTASVESQVVPVDKSSVAAPAESGVAAVSTESDSIAADTESVPTESSVAAAAEPGHGFQHQSDGGGYPEPVYGTDRLPDHGPPQLPLSAPAGPGYPEWEDLRHEYSDLFWKEKFRYPEGGTVF